MANVNPLGQDLTTGLSRLFKSGDVLTDADGNPILVQGNTGIQGFTGVEGSAGGTGFVGSTGIQGNTGIQGLGLTGLRGIPGETGVKGCTGIQGLTGFLGSTGVQGIAGNTGVRGPTGIRGFTGLQGITGIGVADTTPKVLATLSTYNATAAPGNTVLYSVPGGSRAIVTGAVMRLTSVATFTSTPTIGIGNNGAADNIFAAVDLVGLDVAEEYFSFSLGGLMSSTAGGSDISVGLDVSAVAGTYELEIQLIGYLV